ncbi:MAG TPA: ATPase, T2SS/T4P/T4SS family, partial [Planctomycetaceae bacterium]|nr:ATPase, T2SS/T4P/T4SS family [Planctomycetaceae bacterium]
MSGVAGSERFRQRLEGRDAADPQHVTSVVDSILASAREAGASDVHLMPHEAGLAMLFRLDGVLQPVAELPQATSANVIARLKVLAELLTYRTDVPQEGRVRSDDRAVEMRVSTFPTV